ncbi:MAG: sigma-70 family RNA polymerase sigma factor [Planctomycetales bacterium]|nr:sigma-70 family RNA polymerase sigma factor [Planctomycetales bacterium]
MNSTSISLLQRLREDPGAEDWQSLMRDYSPLIRRWLSAHGVQDHDADDITQEVMTILVRRIGEFQRQRTGSFRCWVRTMTVNCMRDHARRARKSPRGTGGSDMVDLMNALSDDHSELSQRWDEQHAQYLLDVMLKKIRPEFRENSWQAFTKTAIEKLSPQVAAEQIGISVNAVFVAKSKVLKRLREEGTGLIDD